MGQTKSNAGRTSVGGAASQSAVNKAAENYATYVLTSGNQSVKLDKATLVSDIDDNGYANVKMDYTTRNRVMVGFDPETRTEQYETEETYHTDTFRMKVGNPALSRSALVEMSESKLKKEYKNASGENKRRIGSELNARGWSREKGTWTRRGGGR